MNIILCFWVNLLAMGFNLVTPKRRNFLRPCLWVRWERQLWKPGRWDRFRVLFIGLSCSFTRSFGWKKWPTCDTCQQKQIGNARTFCSWMFQVLEFHMTISQLALRLRWTSEVGLTQADFIKTHHLWTTLHHNSIYLKTITSHPILAHHFT